MIKHTVGKVISAIRSSTLGLEKGLPSKQDLPFGWEIGKDPISNVPYYFNRETEEVSWEKPIELRAATRSKEDV